MCMPVNVVNDTSLIFHNPCSYLVKCMMKQCIINQPFILRYFSFSSAQFHSHILAFWSKKTNLFTTCMYFVDCVFSIGCGHAVWFHSVLLTCMIVSITARSASIIWELIEDSNSTIGGLDHFMKVKRLIALVKSRA